MSAVINPDAGTPAACEARRLRLVAARAQQATRLAELMQARSIRSRVRIRTESEVYAELNNLIAAIEFLPGSVMERWKLALVEVATDLDNELVPQPYSETGTEPRGGEIRVGGWLWNGESFSKHPLMQTVDGLLKPDAPTKVVHQVGEFLPR